MTEKTLLAQLIAGADTDTEMDNSCKKLLSHKLILAWILKHAVAEYAEHSVTAIAERYILDDTIQISQVPVHHNGPLKGKTHPTKVNHPQQDSQDKQVFGMNTESKLPGEGKITFDLLFQARIPSGKKIANIFINIESQDNFYPGYPLIKRAIYYCCRMLSAQYGTVFTHSKYDKLRKVYSIWICTSPPKYRENSITKYGLFEQNLLGKVRELRKNYDLLSILIICLKKENIPVPEKNNLIDMLSTLLSPILSADEKENILENQFNIPMTKEIKEDMIDMCNISRSIRIDGIKEGFSQGISKGRLEDLRSLMTNLKLTASQAMDALSIPPEDRQYYLQNIS